MKTTHTDVADNRSGSLYKLVDASIKKYSAIARNNRNSLINNVNNNLNIFTDETIVGSVIEGVLQAINSHVKESLIYISAKELYGKMIEINVKDDNCYNTFAVAISLQDMVPLAEMIGGKLNITNQRQKITTVSFTFPQQK